MAEGPRPSDRLYDSAAVALALFDDDGVLTEVNATMAQLLGREAAGLRGLPLGDFMSPAGRVLYDNHLLPLLRLAGRVEELTLQLRPVRGPDLFVMCSAVREVGVDGRARNECAFMRMHERKRVEAELLRIKRAAEHVPGMLFQLLQDRDGSLRLPFASARARTLLGLHPTQVGQPDVLMPLLHPEDRTAVRESLQASAMRMAPWRTEFRVRLPDGSAAWRAVEARPQRTGDGGVLWHGYATDIGERKAMEAAQIERDAAQRANRAKSEFMSRASHELRTPLNGILGFARLLAGEPGHGLREDQLRKLRCIDEAGQSLLRLIDELLDIAGIESGRLEVALEPLALAPLVARCMALVEPQAQQAGVALAADLAPPGLQVQGHAGRIEQVLLNLLGNAVKYNRPQGRVELTVRVQGLRACITVADTGLGLSPDQQAQLFQPFNRLGAERGPVAGAGLGLVIARGLAELMHGRLEVDSRLGAGSRFSLWLDVAEAAAPPPVSLADWAALAPATGATSVPRRVLYVEDNPLNVLLMEALFELRPQWRLEVAGDIASGEAAALRLRPHLLLLDMQLPDGEGSELLARLRGHAALAGVPAVAVSANAMAEDIRRATDAGFLAYWTKPLDMTCTLRELDRLLGAPA